MNYNRYGTSVHIKHTWKNPISELTPNIDNSDASSSRYLTLHRSKLCTCTYKKNWCYRKKLKFNYGIHFHNNLVFYHSIKMGPWCHRNKAGYVLLSLAPYENRLVNDFTAHTQMSLTLSGCDETDYYRILMIRIVNTLVSYVWFLNEYNLI